MKVIPERRFINEDLAQGNIGKREEGKQDSNNKVDNTGNNLTPKQRAFCKEYVIDYNGTQAAIRAGYSEDTAQEQSSRLLSNVMVTAYLQRLEDEKNIERDLTAGFILAGLKDIAVHGQRDADKVRSYELLGKHRKLFTEQIDVNATSKITREEIIHKEG